MRKGLISVILVVVCACGPTATTRFDAEHARPTDVRWLTLVRDYDTAKRYTGVTIRVSLEPGEYECLGGEIRVWASARTMPPVLVFRMRPGHPVVTGPVSVVGLCSGPTRDGSLRSRNIDYVVVVEGCAVVTRGASSPP